MSARTSVGEMPSVVTRCRSTSCPQAIRAGIIGRAVVEHHRRAEQQRAEDEPRPHHPAHVGDPEERFVGVQVEAVAHVLRGLDREAAVRVHGALWAGRSCRRCR